MFILLRLNNAAYKPLVQLKSYIGIDLALKQSSFTYVNYKSNSIHTRTHTQLFHYTHFLSHTQTYTFTLVPFSKSNQIKPNQTAICMSNFHYSRMIFAQKKIVLQINILNGMYYTWIRV